MSELLPQMRENVGDARALERLFKTDGPAFAQALPTLLTEFPDSGVLQAWDARLNPETESTPTFALGQATPGRRTRTAQMLALVIILSLAAGTFAKIPAFFGGIEDFFYPRYFSFCVLPMLAAYFAIIRPGSARTNLLALVALALAGAYISLLPGDQLDNNPRLVLACLHLPAFLGWVVFAVFAGKHWRETDTRAEYVRLIGESVVYTALILITGAIMTFVTLGLFNAINLRIEDFYMKWVVVYGLAAAPVVGTHLASERMAGRLLLAPLIARLFSPLVLITLVVYLIGVAMNLPQLFSDRDSLLIFNIVSWIVLAMAAFNICAWQKPGWLDRVLLALVGLTLLVNLIALVAISHRVVNAGWTPNRTALLGWNVLMSAHLAVLCGKMFGDIRRTAGMENSRRWLLGYLPVYTVWNTIVLFTVSLW